MTITDQLEEIRLLDGTTTFPPLSRSQILQRLSSVGLSLPAGHIEFLEMSDGLMVYGGYFRIFGIDTSKPINLISWNAPTNWKFAWERKADQYLCFGENAWGDQYAYRLEDLKAGDEVPIRSLDTMTMEKVLEWSCFQEFFDREMHRNAISAYDTVISAAREIHGDLSSDENLIHTPSMLISGIEDPENFTKMPSATAMTVNGDLWRQLAYEPVDRVVAAVAPYQDDRGRMRMRVIWAD